MSQEWDEVLHEVRLMVKRLDAFRDDLRAAAAGSELTEDQCAIVYDITGITDAASVNCLKLYIDATSGTAKEGDTQK